MILRCLKRFIYFPNNFATDNLSQFKTSVTHTLLFIVYIFLNIFLNLFLNFQVHFLSRKTDLNVFLKQFLNQKQKNVFGFYFHSTARPQRKPWQEFKQVRILEAEADAAEVMEGCCLLPSSANFLTEPRRASPGKAPPTMSWAFHH